MKTPGTLLFLLILCVGCSTFAPVQTATERYGPGQDSDQFRGALQSLVEPDGEALSSLASWYPEKYGFENLGEETVLDAAGVLVITEDDVIFLMWNGADYVTGRTISREHLKAVVAEVLGKSRRLVLVTESNLDTFELVSDDRRYVDAEGTEAIAALLADGLSGN